ncbi:MAG: hypothetical protein KF777_19000 [Planctomycetaceae bacterium]|jgi:hypothetical protein|nr:hypothetical protein [Planctomycetaceae bacterium]
MVDPVEKPRTQPFSQTVAALIGFLTCVPLSYLFFFMAIILIEVLGSEPMSRSSFMLLFVVHVLIIVLVWCLIGFYIYFLFKSDFVKQDQKALWAVVLFLGNMLAMPVFWYLYIWKPAEEAAR